MSPKIDVFFWKASSGGSFLIQKISSQICFFQNNIFWSYILEKMSKKGREGEGSFQIKKSLQIYGNQRIFTNFSKKNAMKNPKIRGGESKAI